MKNYPTPKSPLKAHDRIIRKMLDSISSKKAEHRKDEYALINRVFKRAGGSWRELFLGSPEHTNLLKKVIKLAFKNKYITRKDSWAG